MCGGKRMWELLVPVQLNDGTPVSNHDTMFAWIRGLCGGLTVCPQVQGHWEGPDKRLYVEPMVPVRFYAEPATMRRVADVVRQSYKQECVCVVCLGEALFLD